MSLVVELRAVRTPDSVVSLMGLKILGMIRDGESQLLPYLAPYLRFYLSFLQHTAGRWADNPHEEGYAIAHPFRKCTKFLAGHFNTNWQCKV